MTTDLSDLILYFPPETVRWFRDGNVPHDFLVFDKISDCGNFDKEDLLSAMVGCTLPRNVKQSLLVRGDVELSQIMGSSEIGEFFVVEFFPKNVMCRIQIDFGSVWEFRSRYKKSRVFTVLPIKSR